MTLCRIPPSRCTGKYHDGLLEDDSYLAEEKLDGARYMLYLEEDGPYLYSRTAFPSIDKAKNVPHITRSLADIKGIVLDGEMVHPSRQLGDVTSVMNSLPAKAITNQGVSGFLEYHVFDILYYQGEDIRHKPFHERRAILDFVVTHVNHPHLVLVPQEFQNKGDYLRQIIAHGGEGIVLKHRSMSYGVGWVKCKKRADHSVIITGFQQGHGKYANSLGAVIFSVYDNGNLREVGKCSGMTDKVRHDIWQHQTKYLGSVIDVFCQQLTPDKRFRHAVWHRPRPDVEAVTCTWEKISNE